MDILIDNLVLNNMYVYLILICLIVFIALFITLTFLIYQREDKEHQEAKAIVESLLPDENLAKYDIEKITEALEAEKKSSMSYTDFEQEQEAKAIISYDQLVKSVDQGNTNISVQKVTFDDPKEPSHHRVALEQLITEDKEQLDILENPVVVTKAYLDDLKALKSKLKKH